MQNHEQINQLKNLVQDLLDESKKQGATSAEAGLSVDNGLSVTARLGEVETIEHHCDQSLGVTVYIGKKKGSASTNDFSTNSIKETVKAACSIAGFSSVDEYAGLPDKEMLATEFPELDRNHPWDIDAESAINLAVQCEDAARSYHAEISNSEGATVNSHQGIRVLGNSLGFLQGYQSTRHSISCSVLGERDGNMQRDYWYSVSRNPAKLESAQEIGLKAAERTIKRLGARGLTTRQCPVLYSAEVASGLIGSLISA
ncbi:MAG: metalloprotease PmbA, partial [Methylococcales bacterium]|nr:metalloprotease PmbA [Methylococcales bacterium]